MIKGLSSQFINVCLFGLAREHPKKRYGRYLCSIIARKFPRNNAAHAQRLPLRRRLVVLVCHFVTHQFS